MIAPKESPLGIWIARNNPVLAKELGLMDQYDAVCKICKEYGVKEPSRQELRVESANRILNEIINKQ